MIPKLTKNTVTIKKDKVLHFIAGALITLVSSLVLNNIAIGCIAGIGIGGLKELYDKFSKRGNPEWWDFIVTAIGALFAASLLLLSNVETGI